MKSTYFVIISILVLSNTNSAFAQWHLGLSVMPGLSTFDFQEPNFRHTTPINYGLSLDFQHNKLSYSTGILHFTQGTKIELQKNSEDQPDVYEGTYEIYYRAKSVLIPLLFNYNFYTTKKSSFFASTGFYVGYTYAQQAENTSIPEEGLFLTGQNGNYPLYGGGERFTAIDMFDDFYFGVNLGIGWNYQFTEKFVFQIKPNFLYQMTSKQASENQPFTLRARTWSFNTGVLYTLGK